MKKEKGITLIALVITIIILLILAGISIATLTGENGLVTKANTAKTETKKVNAEEQVKIAVAGSFNNEGKLTADKVKEELRKIPNVGDIRDTDGGFPIEVDLDGYTFEIDGNGKVTRKAVKPVVNYTLSTEEQVNEGEEVTVTITASIGEGETITKITKPDGTTVMNTNTTSFPVTSNGIYTVTAEGSNGETTTKKITITNIGTTEIFSDIYTSTQTYTDSNNRTAKIPEGFAVGISSTINKIDNGLVITDKIDENHKSTGNEFVWVPINNTANFKRVRGYSQGNRQTDPSIGKCTEPYTSGTQQEKNDYTTMYNSVVNVNNKGFYIGRYEAGKENNKVVVKKNKPVYGGVGWSNKRDMTTLTGGAVELAKNFVKTTYTDNNKTVGVVSTLVYGVQWDATMQFFDNNYINGECATNSYVRNSSDKGNYSLLINTGSNENYKMKNIYDMAGNAYEWTMEAYSPDSSYRIMRGGMVGRSDWHSGSITPVSIRASQNPDYAYVYHGFRIALYVNT